MDRYVVGVDVGTLSGRAVVVRVADGAEVGTAVHGDRHAVMAEALAATGAPLPPDWALPDPDDYRDVLRRAVCAAVADAGIAPSQVVGSGIDFTACTVLPPLADGASLRELPNLRDRPPAYEAADWIFWQPSGVESGRVRRRDSHQPVGAHRCSGSRLAARA